MAYEIKYSSVADRELASIKNRKIMAQIVKGTEELKDFPHVSNIKRLETEIDIWRRKIGEWRVTFRVNKIENTITIHHIRQRKDSYRDR